MRGVSLPLVSHPRVAGDRDFLTRACPAINFERKLSQKTTTGLLFFVFFYVFSRQILFNDLASQLAQTEEPGMIQAA